MRPAWADIDLGAVTHNVGVLRDLVAPSRVCAVVKAQGYGHGAVEVARAALAGGADGMDFIRRLLREAPARMSEHAVLVLEIGNESPHFEAAFPQLPVFWLPTSAGEDQVLLVTREALSRFSLS